MAHTGPSPLLKSITAPSPVTSSSLKYVRWGRHPTLSPPSSGSCWPFPTLRQLLVDWPVSTHADSRPGMRLPVGSRRCSNVDVSVPGHVKQRVECTFRGRRIECRADPDLPDREYPIGPLRNEWPGFQRV